ncbi:MAG: UDP-N-acetylglucosamine 2-epimerase (non-hydrolyzing) [Deltaproteobacteria bacterium]|nr:UDP-N-acetylglucosamine 2-epimerase (non-hydrolyzing) [Deltaproteobacteria bacterium]
MRPRPPLRLLFVLGTRPEVLKLGPVVRAARTDPAAFAVRVVSTGQHRDLLAAHLDYFGIALDQDLHAMRPDQDLAGLVARMVAGLDGLFARDRPDWVVVQGDTSTAFAATLSAAGWGVAVAHVEAGLRTGDLAAPFPEEANRRLIAAMARLHCAPTPAAADHLRAEGVAAERIVVTGNTALDALLHVRDAPARRGELCAPFGDLAGGRVLLVTGHRRENFGVGTQAVCAALVEALERWPDLAVVFPLHQNPQVRDPVRSALQRPVVAGRVVLCDPLDYPTFVALLGACWAVLTDSGGVQEEAPALGKPVLCTRDRTERPEGVAAGAVRLVGADPGRIVGALGDLCDPRVYAAMAVPRWLYGDGRAAWRVLAALRRCGAEPG